MSAYTPEKAVKNGWTEWIAPRMRGYNMACCDCGLVHEMQFTVIKRSKQQKKGYTTGKPIKGARVVIRARRNKKDTAMLRRKGLNQ